MDPKLFEQFSKQFGGMFGELNQDQMKQAGNIWKMLDDMAENNPDGYKNFVESNIKTGFEDIKKEKKKKLEEQMVLPQVGFLIKTQAKLKNQKINKEEHPMFDKLLVKENNLEDFKKFKEKVDKEVKFYINVLYHDRVKGPLDNNRHEIKDIKDMSKWKEVPVSVSSISSRKSESYGYNVYFVDAVLNEEVYKLLSSSVQYQVSLIKFVTDTVQREIKISYNPLFDYYNPREVNELIFYEFEKMSLKRHTSKKYKAMEKGQRNEPRKLLINMDYDKKGEFFKNQQKNLDKQQEKAEKQFQDYKDGKNVDLGLGNNNNNQDQNGKNQGFMSQPSDLLNQLNSDKNSNVNESKETGFIQGINIGEKEKQQEKKRPLIQEIGSSETKAEKEQNEQKMEQNYFQNEQKKVEKKEEILENEVEPVYILQERRDQKEIYLEIQLGKVKSFKQIQLDISSKQLKLFSEFLYKLEIQFPRAVDNEQVQAKWEKKSKVLKLTLKEF